MKNLRKVPVEVEEKASKARRKEKEEKKSKESNQKKSLKLKYLFHEIRKDIFVTARIGFELFQTSLSEETSKKKANTMLDKMYHESSENDTLDSKIYEK